ncbi:MAG: protease inhibitor I42 family protein, partial [Phascolarctobacterium sp.]|nr:protease inhibitor I42 family protein [Phascolarctobacterium sp.]
ENAIKNVGSSFIMPRGDDQRTGMPGVEILVFTAQEPGTYNLKLDYKRPWERIGIDSFNFTVVVKE